MPIAHPYEPISSLLINIDSKILVSVIERIFYLPYYLSQTPAHEFLKLVRYVTKEKEVALLPLYFDILCSSVRYNMSFMDYFSFRFYSIPKKEREEYMGSGGMYEFQKKMNPKKFRRVLHNKIEFLQKFDHLCGRNWATLNMLKKNPDTIDHFLSTATGKIVFKYSRGQSGKQVEICEANLLNSTTLIEKMQKNNFDLIEEYIVQNDSLMKLSPSGVNTVRIVTQLHKGEIIIVTTRLRISVNSPVDNASVGNMVVPLNPTTGVVSGPGIYADITKPDEFKHPITGVDLIGFQVPFWKECLQLAIAAALMIPENRSIGWDIAITNEKPLLIEGNHNWHYLVLQMPEKKGYKKFLLQYMDSSV